MTNSSYIDLVKGRLENYFNHLSGITYVRIVDTPRVWGMPLGKDIMPQAMAAQAEFERAIVEVIQKAKYRCDISSLNSPDPDWVRAILGAIDTSLTKRMGRTRPTQFRFLFGQTPMVPIGEPANFQDFKAALVRLIRVRSPYWEVMPEFWMGRFYRLRAGIISVIQAAVFGGSAIGSEDTKTTWNHTKIVTVDGVEALVGGHNLNMDLFRSYPPVHDVSVVVHGDAAYGAQRFLDNMWLSEKNLLTKESFNLDTHAWTNADGDQTKPVNPFAQLEVITYMQERQRALIELHQSGVQPTGSNEPIQEGQELLLGIPEQDLQTLADLRLEVFQERIIYDNYDRFSSYKRADRILTLGKYWSGPDNTEEVQKASEIMKETLIKSAKRIIRMSQMDLISAWKSNWSSHVVCHWLIEALLQNPNLEVQIVVSALDAGAGAEGDQYSFGSGASRTFDLIKYYMLHEVATDQPIPDPDGRRAKALTRLHIAPFYFTDKALEGRITEGKTYKWPDLSKAGFTKTLKQPPLSEKPPERGVIGSAATSILTAGGYVGTPVESAPGNHAKIMIIDDEAYVVGSDNLYPGFLSEVDYLVEGADAVSEMLTSYWNPLWHYSSPHCVPVAGGNWMVVDRARLPTPASGLPCIGIDPRGIPHMAYGNGWPVGKVFATRLVDGVVQVISGPLNMEGDHWLAGFEFSDQGAAYLLTEEANPERKRDLIVRRLSDGNWQVLGGPVETINGYFPVKKLGIDQDGTVFVASVAATTSNGFVATVHRFAGGQWQSLGTIPGVAIILGVSFPQPGSPVICFYSEKAGVITVHVVHYKDGRWVALGTPISGVFPDASVVASAGGTLYLAYAEGRYYEAKIYVRRFDGTEWVPVGDDLIHIKDAEFRMNSSANWLLMGLAGEKPQLVVDFYSSVTRSNTIAAYSLVDGRWVAKGQSQGRYPVLRMVSPNEVSLAYPEEIYATRQANIIRIRGLIA